MGTGPSSEITPLPGFPLAVGRLACMLAYARETTLAAVAGLCTAQLDHRTDEQANSIGALLAHLAAVESVFQVLSFHGRDLTPDEAARLEPALSLGPEAAGRLRGRSLDSLLDELARVRGQTLRELARKDDAWLDEVVDVGGGPMNQHWIWFHVIEDEFNHRGQIKWVRSRLPADLAV